MPDPKLVGVKLWNDTSPIEPDLLDGWYHDDALWMVTCSCIIFNMQTGFGMLESGCVSLKNEVNIMMKNLVDVVLGGVTYWAFGRAVNEPLRRAFSLSKLPSSIALSQGTFLKPNYLFLNCESTSRRTVKLREGSLPALALGYGMSYGESSLSSWFMGWGSWFVDGAGVR